MAVGCMEQGREDELQKRHETTSRVIEMFVTLIWSWL